MRQYNVEERKLLYKLKVSNAGKKDLMAKIRREFAAIFPRSRVPNRSTVNRLEEKIEDTGIMLNLYGKNIANPRPTTSGRQLTVRTQPNIIRISNQING